MKANVERFVCGSVCVGSVWVCVCVCVCVCVHVGVCMQAGGEEREGWK